ncbi:ANTAR domain-containing protein [Nocardioides pakistanensis]
MTGTIDEPVRPGHRTDIAALLDQAKGVLIFRYSIDADAASSLLALWAAEYGVSPEAVARTVVHEICQGRRGQASDRGLARWLEDRLRHEMPT